MKPKPGRHHHYHLVEEMRRLADGLHELALLYRDEQPDVTLAAYKEARMLAGLAHQVEAMGQATDVASSAMLRIEHMQKIKDAIEKRRTAAPLPIDAVFSEVKEEPNGRPDDRTE